MNLILPTQPLLFDEPVPMKVEGAAPLALVELRTRLQDAHGQTWEAWGRFAAQNDGTVDPSRDTPLEASYFGFDPLGLLWSMAPRQADRSFETVPGPLSMEVEATCPDETSARGSVTRLVGQKGQNHAGGELYAADSDLTVVLLSRHQDGAAMLAARGFRTLRLELPPLPVSLDWLKDQLDHLSDEFPKIALVASARAAEYALLVATRRPPIRALALCSGSGLAFADSWAGVPGIPVEPAKTSRKAYEEAVVDRQQRNRGRIEVERIEAPILFISGQQDGFWPSSAFSEVAVQRLRKLGQEFPAEHLTFAEAGHLLGPDGGVPHRPTGFLADLGGRPAHQAQAQRQAWQKLLKFLSAVG